MTNLKIHNQTTNNHAKTLTQFHSLVETFVSIRDDYILNVFHEVRIHREVEAGRVIYPWDRFHFQIGPPNREVCTLAPSIGAMKSNGE